MSYSKFDPKFPAVLKTPDDRLLETGTASISVENKSVDFKSDFVPLFKMGTPVKIVRVEDSLEVHSFTGQIYLSSQRMLRIVAVHDEVLPGAKYAFLYDVALVGRVHAALLEQLGKKRCSLFHRKPARRDCVFDVSVHAISMQNIKFTSDRPLEEGQTITIDLASPAISSAKLEVEQVLTFGQDVCNCRCRILDLNASSHTCLDRFVGELSLLAHKPFA